MNRNKLNLILLLIVCGLAIALLHDSAAPPDSQPALTALRIADIERIAIAHGDAATIELQREDGRWWLTAPKRMPADPTAVGSLQALATTPVLGSVSAPRSLAALQLEPPALRLGFNDQWIDVGGVEPLQYRRYARVDGAIQLINDPPALLIDSDYSDLASRRLLAEGSQLQTVAVPGLRLQRGADGAWSAEPAASSEAIAAVVDSWSQAEALWNQAAPTDPVVAASDDWVLIDSEGAEHRFRVAARSPQLQLINLDTGILHVLSAELADRLSALPPPADAADTPAAAH